MIKESNNDLLIRIDERTISLLDRMDKLEKTVSTGVPLSEHLYLMQKVAKHDKRIVSLENWRIKVVARFTIIATVIATVISILSTLIVAFAKELLGLK